MEAIKERIRRLSEQIAKEIDPDKKERLKELKDHLIGLLKGGY